MAFLASLICAHFSSAEAQIGSLADEIVGLVFAHNYGVAECYGSQLGVPIWRPHNEG